MVESNGFVRLIDLGLVGDVKSAEPGTAVQETMTVGTVEYLSPEQARGRSDLDARADMYSLGITLYHMVVGEVPFEGETDYEVMAKQILKSVDAQKIKMRRIEPEIYYLIAKMSAKDRAERYTHVREAIEVIQGYLPQGIVEVDFGVPPVAQPIEPPAPPPARPVARPAAKPGPKPMAKPSEPPAKSAPKPAPKAAPKASRPRRAGRGRREGGERGGPKPRRRRSR